MEENEKISPERPAVRIHIDQHEYHSPSPSTGAALYALGKVQGEADLFREVTGDREDRAIENGDEKIHLTEDEHFHSGPPKETTIIVNGKKKVVSVLRETFDALVALAFNPVPSGPNTKFTVTYGHGPRMNPEGALLEGGTVKIKDRMVFSVTSTDKS